MAQVLSVQHAGGPPVKSSAKIRLILLGASEHEMLAASRKIYSFPVPATGLGADEEITGTKESRSGHGFL